MTVTFPATSAAVSLTTNIEATLQAFKADTGMRLQVYPGRPASLHLPSVWQDERRDDVEFSGVYDYQAMQHTLEVDVIALHGTFDSADTVAQRDAFVDTFLSWLRENRKDGLAGPNSVLSRLRLRDVPSYDPDWLPDRRDGTRQLYYATIFTLEVTIED